MYSHLGEECTHTGQFIDNLFGTPPIDKSVPSSEGFHFQ